MHETRDQLAGVLREASQAEMNGDFAMASLLALHALQLDPNSTEAKEIFNRSQGALGRPNQRLDQGDFNLSDSSSQASSTDAPHSNPVVQSLRTDPPRKALDLSDLPPLTPPPPGRSLMNRLIRAAFPSLVLVLLLVGFGLHFSRSVDSSLVEGATAPSEPLSPSEAEETIVPEPLPPPPPPGTVALNVVPWARVDAIYCVDDGRIIQPDGLISPCTLSLPPGNYRFGVSHPDFGSVELSVKVESDEVTKVEHSLISSEELESQLASGSAFP